MMNLRGRLRRLEGQPRPDDSDGVLILPENGTEPPGYVRRAWDHFLVTLRQLSGVLIVPDGQTCPKA